MDHSDHHDASHNHADMVTSEFDFIYLMIPHHQEAVDTAKVLLTQTSNPSLIELGENIITSQTTEIQTMNSWLTGRYSGEVYTGMGYMPMMRGANNLS
jgi:uncharacterized protein (DUF305 family)